MRDDRARLRDMLASIEHIERYASYGRDRFVHDELVRTFIVHHLQILGEAGSKLSSDLRARHEEIPWPVSIHLRAAGCHCEELGDEAISHFAQSNQGDCFASLAMTNWWFSPSPARVNGYPGRRFLACVTLSSTTTSGLITTLSGTSLRWNCLFSSLVCKESWTPWNRDAEDGVCDRRKGSAGIPGVNALTGVERNEVRTRM
jgi:hypothetical protein